MLKRSDFRSRVARALSVVLVTMPVTAPPGASPSRDVPYTPVAWVAPVAAPAASIPLAPAYAAASSPRPLVGSGVPLPILVGAQWAYFKGTVEPPATWNTIGFDDSSWLTGPSGFGYGDGDDATVLSDMQNGYLSVYTRRQFDVPDASAVAGLTLTVNWDDGFVAFINGQEVARRNLAGTPGTFVAHDITAASHEAGSAETIALSSSLLVNGTNVVAVQGHNGTLGSSDLSLAVELRATNPPPAVPAGASPSDGTTGVSLNPNLCVTVGDPNDTNLDVTFYGREVTAPAADPFTIIALPDTQFYSQDHPDTYVAQTQWIVDNLATRNIAFVTELGDCVNTAATEQQWINADAAWDLVENQVATGLPDGIPYGIAVGNHDQSPANDPGTLANEGSSTPLYNAYFGVSRFAGRGYYGDHYGTNNDNHYELFQAGGMDFIAIHMEYMPADTPLRQAVLSWADNVLKTYPNRRAIVTSHYLINPSDASWGNQGQATWDALKNNHNLFLMLCGHLDQANNRYDEYTDGTGTTRTHTMVSDYQTLAPGGGNGWLRILTFHPDTDTINVETYSPTLGVFIDNHANNTAGIVRNRLTLTYDMAGGTPFVPVGSASGVSGSQVCVPWSGRQGSTTYEWYATVSDGASTTSGSRASFTTGAGACTFASDCVDGDVCTTDSCVASVCQFDPIPNCCVSPADCDDGNPCTDDSCDSGACGHADNTAACDDGNGCTVSDVCAGGTCAGVPNTCNDGNPCTLDSCVDGACVNAYAPSAGCCATSDDCDDGVLCSADSCQGTNCVNLANANCCDSSAQCDDGEACTADTCSPTNTAGLSLNGSTAYVTMGVAPGLGATQFTIETWFNRTGTGVSNTTGTNGIPNLVPLVTKGAPEGGEGNNLDANYILGINTSGNVLAADFEDTVNGGNHPVSGTTAVALNTWNHAAATYDGTTWRLYLNGNLEATSVVGAFTPRFDSIERAALGTMQKSVGASAPLQLGFFAGQLDEVRIWNVVRTLSEIQASMNTQIESAPGLIGRWGLNETAGTNAPDSAAPAEDGTLSGGATWGAGAPAIASATCTHSTIAACCHSNPECDDANPCTSDACEGVTCEHIAIPGCCLGAGDCNDDNPCTDDACVGNACANTANAAPCSDGNSCTTGDACVSGACQGSAIPNCCVNDAECGDANACTTDYCTVTDPNLGVGGQAALTFDGSNDYVTMGVAPGLGATQFTIETWFKRTAAGISNSTGTNGIANLVPLVAKGAPEAEASNVDANYILGISTPANVLAADFEDTVNGANHPVSGTTVLANDTWYHAAATYDGTTWHLYLNGNLEATSVVGTVTPRSDSIQPAGLGTMQRSALAPGQLGFFAGQLDEARIWNTARSQGDIQASMHRELLSAPGLLGRWGLNEGTGTLAHDVTGGEDGTLTNGPTWTLLPSDPLGFGTPASCGHGTLAGCCDTSADCADGDPCTTDTCTANVCSHPVVGGCCLTAADCSDGNVCTDDVCSNNVCSNPANTASCNDGNACTTGDQCSGGACAGTALNCNDGNPCTDDSCNSGTGCVYVNDNANACTDGNGCTGDACVNGACVSWYAPTPSCCGSNAHCNDGNAGTTDTCIGAPSGSCSNVVSGSCTTAAQCNDSSSCTTDSCNGAVIGSALNFDGTNDYVTMGAATGESALGARAFTLEGWVKRDGATWGATTSTGNGGVTAVPLITKGRAESETAGLNCNYFLGITATGRLVADFEQLAAAGGWSVGQNHPACSTASIADQSWHHVAVSYSVADGWRFYLDGVEGTAPDATSCTTCAPVGSCPRSPAVEPEYTSTEHFGLGIGLSSTGTNPSPAGYYAGIMDEVRVWNVVRTPAEIGAAMNQELTAGTGLIGRWGLNDSPAVFTATDSTTPAQNGMLTESIPPVAANGPAWTSDSPFPTIPGTCSNTTIPGCSPCGQDYQCNDSNTCTDDYCSTSNDAALQFDGSNDYVTMGPAAGTAQLGAAVFTLETWFNWAGGGATTSTGAGGIAALIPLVAKGAGEAETPATVNANYILGITGGRLAGDFEDNVNGLNHPVCTATTQPTITTNVWHHAAATYDGAAWKLYLDGVLLPIDTACSSCAGGACTVSPGATPESTSVQHFGLGTTLNSSGVASGFFQGRLDEVRVWNVARSLAQIQADRFRELSSAPNLIGRWSLNEGATNPSATSAADTSGRGNNGTLTGGPTWSTISLQTLGSDTCVHTNVANGTSCTDSDACTQTDTCQSGACSGTNPVTCPAPGQCHTVGTCNPGTGACSNPAAADGTTCDDGNPGTTNDLCTGGVCAGTNLCAGVICDPLDQCHDAGVCNPSTGLCSNPPKADGSTCDDGDACSQTDTCQSGSCVGSNPVICATPDQCHTEGTCNPETGVCSNPPKADGSTCDDGDACTTPDACSVGACIAGAPVDCNDSNPCTDDSCNPAAGCVNAPDDANLGSLTCGVGVCERTVQACAGGQPQTCTPGAPTGVDDSCNGVDENCTGTVDENYVPTPTSCGGPGVCAGTGQLICVDGLVQDTCSPGTPMQASVAVQFGTGTRYRANLDAPGADLTLVSLDSSMRYLTNATDPGVGSAWTSESFDDSAWTVGTFGVGYETALPGAADLLRTSVPSGAYSVYTRATFEIADLSAIHTVLVGADYDDGWVAWINGIEVARSSTMPEGAPAWNAEAVEHESSNGTLPDYGALEDVTSAALPALHAGTNVLSVGVWNSGAPSSTDLVLVPKLALGLDWTREAYDDSSWPAGSFGLGYETDPPGAQSLLLTGVPAQTASVFTRTTFNVVNPAAVQELLLSADYDDGFVAWINGVEVYGSPEIGPSTSWDAEAMSHESSNAAAPNYGGLIDVSTLGIPALHAGSNVLAVGVWNADPSSSTDLVLVPRLSLGEAETCDGLDNDCDGTVDEGYPDLDGDGQKDCVDSDDDADGVPDATDCAPRDAGTSEGPLAQVTDLGWELHPQILRWAEQGPGVVFDVVSGALAALRADGGAWAAACVVDDRAAGLFDDTRPDPAPGAGFYYLVRAQKPNCATGSYGSASAGAERVPTAACP